jgi:hypothetical protein
LYYPQVFETRVPACVVLKCQYDWVSYYKTVTNHISGFTKTAADPHTVQGWKIERGNTGLVELRWQPVASPTTPWLGQDETTLSMGFVRLQGRPMVSHRVANCQWVTMFATDSASVMPCIPLTHLFPQCTLGHVEPSRISNKKYDAELLHPVTMSALQAEGIPEA